AAPLRLRAGVRRGRVELGDEHPVPGEPAVGPVPRAMGRGHNDRSTGRAVGDDAASADVVAAVEREQDLAGRAQDLAAIGPAGADDAAATPDGRLAPGCHELATRRLDE